MLRPAPCRRPCAESRPCGLPAASHALPNALASARPERPRRPPLGSGYRTPGAHRVGEALIHGMALTAIAAIALIFVFIAKEALPLFVEPDAQAEIGGLEALVVARQWGG